MSHGNSCLLHLQAKEKSVSIYGIAKENIQLLQLHLDHVVLVQFLKKENYSHIIVDTQDSSCIAKDCLQKITRGWNKILK